MSIIKKLEEEICEKINKLGYHLDQVTLNTSSRKEFGEYQINDAMNLGKELKKNPREIAEEIVACLKKDSRLINLNIAGPGFINLSLSEDFYIEAINEMIDNIENNIDKIESKKIMMDYGGANIAKTLHVGHLRSANIGEALKRLTKLLGNEVISDVHFGDIGRQSGMVIYELKERYPNLNYFDENHTGEYDELPITEKDLQEIYPTASQKAKENESIMNEVHEITKKIEENDPAYTTLWNKIKDLSIKDIKGIYKRLNTTFDLWEGETDCYPYIPKVIEILKEKNLIYESEGAMVVDTIEETDKEPMPPLVVLKGNGGTVYQTRELATILSREERFSPDEIWYFTDNRQELYFKQVFRVAKKSGIALDKTELKFFGFGTMNGTDGKPFKTRSGGVMNLVDLIEMVKDETRKRMNIEMVGEDNLEEVAEIVAIAALKYADFLPYRSKDYIFDVNKFVDLEGKTGPYLLYSTVRMKSLLNKANYKVTKEEEKSLSNETDKEVIQVLLKLPVVLKKAYEEKSLNEIAEYLYKLTSTYNKFYSENHILTCENTALKNAWLSLTQIVYDTNTLLLNTLGIDIPEKM